MKGYILDIKCQDMELAKLVETCLRFIGSGSYAKPDDLSFKINCNPMHVCIVTDCLFRAAQSQGYPTTAVKFYHDGQELS